MNAYLSGNNTGPALLSSINKITSKLENLPYQREPVVPNVGIKELAYSSISRILDIQLAPKDSLYRFVEISDWDVQKLLSNIENEEAYSSNFCLIFDNKKDNTSPSNYRLIDGNPQNIESYSESSILEMTNAEWTHDWLFSSFLKTYNISEQDFEEVGELIFYAKHLSPYNEETCMGNIDFLYEEYVDGIPVTNCYFDNYEVFLNSSNECYWGKIGAEFIILDSYRW